MHTHNKHTACSDSQASLILWFVPFFQAGSEVVALRHIKDTLQHFLCVRVMLRELIRCLLHVLCLCLFVVWVMFTDTRWVSASTRMSNTVDSTHKRTQTQSMEPLCWDKTPKILFKFWFNFNNRQISLFGKNLNFPGEWSVELICSSLLIHLKIHQSLFFL